MFVKCHGSALSGHDIVPEDMCVQSGSALRAVVDNRVGLCNLFKSFLGDFVSWCGSFMPSAYNPPMASPPTEKLPRALGHLVPLLVHLPAFTGPLYILRISLSCLSPMTSESLMLRASRAHAAVGAFQSPLSPQTVKAPADNHLCCPPLWGALSPK